MDTSQQPRLPTPATQDSEYSRGLAKGSWMSALMAILLLALGQLPVAQVSTEFDAPPFIVVGLIVGVAALFGVSNYGTKGILAPAVVGIAIDCLLLSNLVINFIAARAKAQRAETPSQSTLVERVRAVPTRILQRGANQIDMN